MKKKYPWTPSRGRNAQPEGKMWAVASEGFRRDKTGVSLAHQAHGVHIPDAELSFSLRKQKQATLGRGTHQKDTALQNSQALWTDHLCLGGWDRRASRAAASCRSEPESPVCLVHFDVRVSRFSKADRQVRKGPSYLTAGRIQLSPWKTLLNSETVRSGCQVPVKAMGTPVAD